MAKYRVVDEEENVTSTNRVFRTKNSNLRADKEKLSSFYPKLIVESDGIHTPLKVYIHFIRGICSNLYSNLLF